MEKDLQQVIDNQCIIPAPQLDNWSYQLRTPTSDSQAKKKIYQEILERKVKYPQYFIKFYKRSR